MYNIHISLTFFAPESIKYVTNKYITRYAYHCIRIKNHIKIKIPSVIDNDINRRGRSLTNDNVLYRKGG